MSDWRAIPLDRVNWRITASSRNAMVLFSHSTPPRDPKYPAGHEWAGMTLGDLADMGERKWWRTANVGVKAVAAIKELIDRAGAGEDVTIRIDGDSYQPQPWPREPLTKEDGVMSDRDKIIEAMARAIYETPDDYKTPWSEIVERYPATYRDCRMQAEAALAALHASGLPVETVETLSEHIGALLRILEDSPPQNDADIKRVLQIATAFGERCWAEATKETEG